MTSFLKWTTGFVAFCILMASVLAVLVTTLAWFIETASANWFITSMLAVMVIEWRILAGAATRLGLMRNGTAKRLGLIKKASEAPSPISEKDLILDGGFIVGTTAALAVSMVWNETAILCAMFLCLSFGIAKFINRKRTTQLASQV